MQGRDGRGIKSYHEVKEMLFMRYDYYLSGFIEKSKFARSYAQKSCETMLMECAPSFYQTV